MHMFVALGDKKKDIFFSTSGVEIFIIVDCFDKLNCHTLFSTLFRVVSLITLAIISP